MRPGRCWAVASSGSWLAAAPRYRQTATTIAPHRRLGRRPRRVRTGASTAAPRKERVAIQLPCTVRELSEAAGVPAMRDSCEFL